MLTRRGVHWLIPGGHRVKSSPEFRSCDFFHEMISGCEFGQSVPGWANLKTPYERICKSRSLEPVCSHTVRLRLSSLLRRSMYGSRPDGHRPRIVFPGCVNDHGLTGRHKNRRDLHLPIVVARANCRLLRHGKHEHPDALPFQPCADTELRHGRCHIWAQRMRRNRRPRRTSRVGRCEGFYPWASEQLTKKPLAT